MGVWDGIATENGEFAGFFPLGQRDYREAQAALLDRMRQGWREAEEKGTAPKRR